VGSWKEKVVVGEGGLQVEDTGGGWLVALRMI
jgi:hypothetical protein